MADKDLDELAKGLAKAAVGTAALAVAQTTAKKLTDQLTATLGAFDKQLANALKDVDALTKGTGSFNSEAARAIGQARDMADTFDGLVGKLAPLSTILKDVGDRLAITAVSIRESSVAVNIHNETLTQLQAVSVGAANGQAAVSQALGKTQAAADKSSEKFKKVQETAGELGSSMIDAFTALASGEAPMKVLTDKGGEMAKTMLKAKLDGVNLVETFKTLGVATGLLKVTTGEAAAAQLIGAAAFDAAAISAQGAKVAAGELAATETVALAPLGLALGAVALAAGAIGVGFAVGADQINKSNGDLTKGLGLTEEQLARVTDKTATMGDVFQATLNVIGRRIMESPIGDALKGLQSMFGDMLKSIVDRTLDGVTTFLAFWGAAYDTITQHWNNLPLAFSAILTGVVNISTRHIETMVNGWLAGYGKLADLVQKITGFKLPKFQPIDLPELKSVGGAAGQSMADEFMASLDRKKSAMKHGVVKYVKNFSKEVSGETVDIVQDRIVKQGGPAPKKAVGGSRGGASSVKPTAYSQITSEEPASLPAPLEPVRPNPLSGPLKTLADEDLSGLDPKVQALDKLLDQLDQINAASKLVAKSFEDAFGKPGKALFDVIGGMTDLSKAMTSIDEAQARAKANGKDDPEAFNTERFEAQIKGYAAMAGAAKGFFKENSDGYKAMQVAEIAFHTIETLNTIKSMALRGADNASAIAGEAGKQAAFSATAYAKTLSSLPFPFNLLAGAAVLAALVQVGATIKGKPGGGSVPGANDMKTRQEAQGSGSVLGDSKAKSESLEKALTHAQAYENKDLEYGNAMVRSLKSIDDQIGAVAAALARSFGSGGMLSTESLNLGKTGSTATLSNLGFAKSTTRTLQDQGVQFNAASLADIVAGGLSGSTYQQVLETTKKKAFGITTSSKSKVITETGSLDGDFLDQVGKLIGSLGKGVAEAAKALGATDVEGLLANFKVDLGKLSFKDMTGAQIEEALNAIFGKLGDDMAKAAVPAIAEFQKVGEGAFETLVRVARQYEVIDTTLKSVGMTFGAVGIASLGARERLVDLVGGLDNLTDQTAFFAEHFLSEGERLKPVKDSVTSELTRLGQPSDLSREGFKTLVLGLNLATKEGAGLYAALMALAPAFDKVATAVEDKRSSIQDQIDQLTLSSAALLARSRAKEMEAVQALDASLASLLKTLWGLQDAAEAAKLATDRSNMYADLLEARGQADAAKALRRANALAAITDPVQKQYQEQIWAAEDAAAKVAAARDILTEAYQRERDAIQATKDKFAELSKSLRGFSASLSANIAGADLAGRYRTTRQAFLATAAMARLGDPDAMGRLQSEGEAFTAASRDYVSTSQDYLRDVGLVRSAVDEAADTADRQVTIAEEQLNALNKSVEGLIQINASVVSVRDAIAGLQGALAQQAAVLAAPAPVPNSPKPETNSNWANPGKTLDGKYYYDNFLGDLAATTASHDPQYYPGGVNPALTPGMYEYSTLETFKERDPNGYYYLKNSLNFATGGSFEVAGSGPPDSKFFGLALSPGEAVNVRRRGDSADQTLVNELRRLREELADLRATSARIATSNDKMERTLTNVTEGGRAMQTQAAA